jgi:hypothetical protein
MKYYLIRRLWHALSSGLRNSFSKTGLPSTYKKVILELDGFIEGTNGEIDWCIMDEVCALAKSPAMDRCSVQIDSYDSNEFANRPLITNLLITAREVVVKNLKEEGHADIVGDW